MSHVQAWNFLGLCQVSMGDIRLGAAAYERVLRTDPNNLEAWMHLAQARKEVGFPFRQRIARRGIWA